MNEYRTLIVELGNVRATLSTQYNLVSIFGDVLGSQVTVSTEKARELGFALLRLTSAVGVRSE